MKYKTLANSLAKVGIPAGPGEPRKIDLGHGLALHLDYRDSHLACILARDIVSGETTFTDVTRWTAREIADWASQRYAGRRQLRGVNITNTEFWFHAIVSRNHLRLSGAPLEMLETEDAKVRYVLSFTDEAATFVAFPI